jgi:hypothetical protein
MPKLSNTLSPVILPSLAVYPSALRIDYRSRFFWFLSAALEGLLVGVKLV